MSGARPRRKPGHGGVHGGVVQNGTPAVVGGGVEVDEPAHVERYHGGDGGRVGFGGAELVGDRSRTSADIYVT